MRAIQARRESGSTEPPDPVDYVEGLCPNYDRFDYFRPYADAWTQAIGGELRICFHAPPQHGKTEFTLRCLLWVARWFPGHRNAYVTYNKTRALDVSKEFRRVALDAGFEVTGTLELVRLRWASGETTTVKFTSIEASLTGYPITGVGVVDDFIAGPEEARSAARRKLGVSWWKSVARTRRHPGTSYIVMATRWPGGDLTEHLTTKEGFEYIRLAAIAQPANDNDLDADGTVISDPLRRKQGESLWRRKPPEFFREDKADRYWWSAMFQGLPIPEGGRVFAEPGSFDEEGNPQGPRYYRELPKSGYRIAFGVDLACTSKTRADWSICVEGWAVGSDLYIVDVQRKQVEAPSFLLTLVAKKTQRPGAPFRFYGSGTEKAAAQFIRAKLGGVFKFLPATADKLVRATPAATEWNAGYMLLPDTAVISAPWLEDFLAVVVNFTGTDGEPDDDVDALAALRHQLMKKSRMFQALTKTK